MTDIYKAQERLGGCILGFSLFPGILSIISALVTINDLLFRVIYGIFSIGWVIHGILLYIGSSQVNLKISKIGSKIGIIFCIIIISWSVYGYIWLNEKLLQLDRELVLGYLVDPIISLHYYVFKMYQLRSTYKSGMVALNLNILITFFGTILTIYVYIKTIRSEFETYPRSRLKRVITNKQLFSSENEPISMVTLGNGSEPRSKAHLDDSFIDHSKPLVCPICNYKNPSESRLCISCNSKFLKCSICKKQISKEDEVFCPYCSAPYHKRDFFEWLKVKAHCKHCKKDFDLWDFQKYLEESEEDHELPAKLCTKCRKNIPIDANFCIYCGFKI